MIQFLWVFLGGGLGSVSRYGISKLITHNFNLFFPLATLIANVLSCIILISLMVFFSEKKIINQNMELLLFVGFCGGFSTFSTFSLETVLLFRSGYSAYAILNIALSLAMCIGIVFILSKKLTI
ncbi:MAG: fluoride efflux transporter CrcB [Bacteroidetes bacterium]|nr:fluoride efflux transporter CrcB [Bacteroidota bacterium]HET6244797.1 fluoride efflux transporter CrcB [Bacteroidia bacterium]